MSGLCINRQSADNRLIGRLLDADYRPLPYRCISIWCYALLVVLVRNEGEGNIMNSCKSIQVTPEN